MIRRNIELESRLIDDLLDLSRIARGRLRLDLEVVDIHEVSAARSRSAATRRSSPAWTSSPSWGPRSIT